MKLHNSCDSTLQLWRDSLADSPEEKHWMTASSYLCCSSLTKTLEKPTHPCFFSFSVLFIYLLFFLTGCQRCTFVFFSKALEGAVTNRSKSYHFQNLVVFFALKSIVLKNHVGALCIGRCTNAVWHKYILYIQFYFFFCNFVVQRSSRGERDS